MTGTSAHQAAGAAVANEDVQRLAEAAKHGQAKLWVKYTAGSGVEVAASELTWPRSLRKVYR